MMHHTEAMQVPQHVCKVCGNDQNLPKSEPRFSSMLMDIMVQGATRNVLEDHEIVLPIMSCHRPAKASDNAVVGHAHHELHLCDKLLSILHTLALSGMLTYKHATRKAKHIDGNQAPITGNRVSRRTENMIYLGQEEDICGAHLIALL